MISLKCLFNKLISLIKSGLTKKAKLTFEQEDVNKKISVIYNLFVTSESRVLVREKRLSEMRLQRERHRQRMADNVLAGKKDHRPYVPHVRTGLMPPSGRPIEK